MNRSRIVPFSGVYTEYLVIYSEYLSTEYLAIHSDDLFPE